ncbi:DNA-protecting protein DprA [Candidatus Uhrbacteria bacterium]|jgi:DNA processing protein|nr:DNA-protecting protein DprA [Candidatus Uhrbacteria bacterium]
MNDRIKILQNKDSRFPTLLSEIHDPPERLFFRGQLSEDPEVCVAVVGTRKATHYGKHVTKKLVTELARHNITIVSGLAYGIDAEAHRATLDAGGRTIAVLAGGVDNPSITPRAHEDLAHEIIAAGGCIMSEHPPGTSSRPYHFPARNRIIAGMCQLTLIIEAQAKSGTMITAAAALRENRDVLVVPGPITSPYSEGPHQLLKDGAIPVTCTQDILEILDLTAAHAAADIKRVIPMSEDERSLLEFITHEPINTDELSRISKISITSVTQLLTLLELKTLVTHVGSGCYTKT